MTCNSCSVIPIRGIRYRCANCVDFDLCEHCEALDSHPKTHLFYKVRIPAPFLGNPRQAQTPWYPGKPGLMPPALPQDVIRKFTGEPACGCKPPIHPRKHIRNLILGTIVEPPEIEALYEQFKCLAATEYLSDPLGLNGAISRQTFDKCFVPNTHVRPPPPNLIYDRMFAFYDTDSNGLIGFEEFVRGLSALNNKHRNPEKLRRIFGGYDLDGDGYVDRRDFLRMFRAFYALSKDLVKDMVASMDDDMLEANQASNVLVGSQPISAAFAGSIPPGSRREGKGGADWGGDEDSDTDVAAVVLPSGTDRVSRAEIRADLDRRHSESAAFTLPEVRRGGGTTAHREPGEDDQTFEDWLAAGEDFNSASSAAVAATMPALASADSTHSSASSFVSSPPPPTSTTSAPNTGPSVAEEADFNQHVEAAELASQRRLEFSTAESPGLSDEGNEGLGGMGMGDQDVGSEILYQITQQGLNELLDLLFAAKEEMALETRKGGEAAAAAAATATPESTEVPKGESTVEVEGAQVGEGGENKDGEGENKDGEGEGEGADGSDKEVEKKEMSKEEKEIVELERAREEIKVRGGEGRLNFKEFEQIMRGKHGRDLGFVSAWIDMASF